MLEGFKKIFRDWRSPPQWKFYLWGKGGIEAMFEACESAQISIDCEQFIFGNDEVGRKFLELFVQKRKEGVVIRLLLDAAGSWQMYSSQWPDLLRDAGIEIRFFNPIRPWRFDTFTTWYFRTHRKILVIDHKVGFCGGLGIREDMYSWRDTMFSIRGGIVSELGDTFEQAWNKVRDRNKVFFRFRKIRAFVKGFSVSTNAPRYRQRHIYWGLIDAIRNAEKSILLTTPYFVPDRRFMRTLRLAAHRGVDVKLLIPEKLDNRLIDILVESSAHSHYSRLMRSGARVFEYQKGFLHAKTVVIDGKWATVGSFNLDHLSFLWNYETNVESTEPGFVAELVAHFSGDLLLSKEIVPAEWERRAFWKKILEFLTLPLHSFL